MNKKIRNFKNCFKNISSLIEIKLDLFYLIVFTGTITAKPGAAANAVVARKSSVGNRQLRFERYFR